MEEYKLIFKAFLSEYVSTLRKMRNLTQEQMAERLHISSRAYRDLERGKYCSSSMPLLFLFLTMSEEELMVFLKRFREKINDLEKKGNGKSSKYYP